MMLRYNLRPSPLRTLQLKHYSAKRFAVRVYTICCAAYTHYLLRTLKCYTVMHIDVLHMLLSAYC
jgi:hypothetical protein